MKFFVKSFLTAVIALLAAVPFFVTPVLAQFAGQINCNNTQVPGYAKYCHTDASVTGSRLVQSSHQAAESIRTLLTDRFFETGNDTSASFNVLNYADSSDGEVADGAFSDFDANSSVAPSRTIWGDGSVTYSDRVSATAGFKGHLASGSLGFDHQIGEGGVLGVFANVETSDYDTTGLPGAGFLRGKGVGVGIYGGQLLGDSVFASTSLHYRHVDNDFMVAATGASYVSRSLSGNASLTGYYQFDAFRLSPSAGVTISREWQDAFTDTNGVVTAAQQTTAGILNAGIEAGYTFFSADGARSIEPWVGASLELLFLNDEAVASLDPLNALDVRLGTGINAAISDNATLSLRGDVSGLTTGDYVVLSAGGQLAVRY